jgi:uncharacterized protein (TIGR02284 family)
MSVDSQVARDLIETLQDGRTGFADAADKLEATNRAEWATTLRRFSAQRADFAAELEKLGAAYGDDVHEDGSVAAKVHRGWMAVKDKLSGSDADGVLDAAVSGENHTVSEYDEALAKDLSVDLREVVARQAAAVKAAREEITALQTAS